MCVRCACLVCVFGACLCLVDFQCVYRTSAFFLRIEFSYSFPFHIPAIHVYGVCLVCVFGVCLMCVRCVCVCFVCVFGVCSLGLCIWCVFLFVDFQFVYRTPALLLSY